MKITNSKGFTLIELLIVVAIIAILAAIAIPQFALYRERGVRASMVSDARNLATAEEAYFADTQTYATVASIGAGASGTVGPDATGQPVKTSKGNSVAITGGTSYSIVVTNASGAGANKSPLTLTGGGGVANSCSYNDGTPC